MNDLRVEQARNSSSGGAGLVQRKRVSGFDPHLSDYYCDEGHTPANTTRLVAVTAFPYDGIHNQRKEPESEAH